MMEWERRKTSSFFSTNTLSQQQCIDHLDVVVLVLRASERERSKKVNIKKEHSTGKIFFFFFSPANINTLTRYNHL
jgi:hypothetical protein